MIAKKVDTTYILRLDKGEEIISSLKIFCEENKITAGAISGFGVASDITLICFDTETKSPKKQFFKGDFEVTSFLGNISHIDNELFIHLHATLVDNQFRAFGGHFAEGIIGLTGEFFIQSIDTKIDRIKDENLGFHILNF